MEGNMLTHRYDDIIDLPHRQSPTRPRMSRLSRAAQFAPFAALTGHDAAILETGRLTDAFTELDESRKAELDDKLRYIRENLHEKPEVVITYFRPDGKKRAAPIPAPPVWSGKLMGIRRLLSWWIKLLLMLIEFVRLVRLTDKM